MRSWFALALVAGCEMADVPRPAAPDPPPLCQLAERLATRVPEDIADVLRTPARGRPPPLVIAERELGRDARWNARCGQAIIDVPFIYKAKIPDFEAYITVREFAEVDRFMVRWNTRRLVPTPTGSSAFDRDMQRREVIREHACVCCAKDCADQLATDASTHLVSPPSDHASDELVELDDEIATCLHCARLDEVIRAHH